jgi:hypothetical protein
MSSPVDEDSLGNSVLELASRPALSSVIIFSTALENNQEYWRGISTSDNAPVEPKLSHVFGRLFFLCFFISGRE